LFLSLSKKLRQSRRDPGQKTGKGGVMLNRELRKKGKEIVKYLWNDWGYAFAIAVLCLLAGLYFFGRRHESSKEPNQPIQLTAEERIKLLHSRPATNPNDQSILSGGNLITEPLVNEFGISRKVVMRRAGIRPSIEPGGIQDGNELRYFQPYFVFQEKQIDGLKYYQIGSIPKRVSIMGWVSINDAQLWDTRIGLRYARQSEKEENRSKSPLPPLYVFGTAEELTAAMEGKAVEPIAKTSYSYEFKTLMPWPIVSKKTIQVNGRDTEIYEIAFLGSHKAGADISHEPENTAQVIFKPETERKELAAQVKSGVSKLDVVFVIDTTMSMQDEIDNAKEAVRMVTAGLKEAAFKPDLAFGLVEYRDYVDGVKFSDNKVVRSYGLTTKVIDFLNYIGNQVREARVSSEEWSETVLEGIMAALNPEEINGNSNNWWRGEGLSERIIILIGDNSAHLLDSPKNPFGLTMGQLAGVAREEKRHVTIFSLLAGNNGPEPEIALHREQFTAIAEKTGGKCYPLDQAREIIPLVEKIVAGGTQAASDRFIATQNVELGRFDPTRIIAKPAATLTTDERKIVEVMEFLKSAAGINLADLAPGQTAFATGWVSPESANMPILEKETYLAKDELSHLIGDLLAINRFLTSRPEAMEALIAEVIDARAEGHSQAIKSFLRGDEIDTLDLVYKVNGIPVGPQSILNFTMQEIRAMMSEERRADISRQIEGVCVRSLTTDLGNQDRFPDPDPLNFGWVREKFLP